jgi:hypothetical protein
MRPPRRERLATKRMNRGLNCKPGFVAAGRPFPAHRGFLPFRRSRRHFSREKRAGIPLRETNASS